MSVIVEGIYKQGRIELLQAPPNLPEGLVRIIVLPEDERSKPPPRLMTFGMYAGDNSVLEDYQHALWQKEWDSGHG